MRQRAGVDRAGLPDRTGRATGHRAGHPDHPRLWEAPAVVTEKVGGTTLRTTTTTFDGVGRSSGQTVTAVPAVTTGYSSTTGLPTTTTTSVGSITVGYDAIGQATSYTQARWTSRHDGLDITATKEVPA